MSARRSSSFHVLIVAADGARVVRFAVSRRALHGLLAAAFVGTVSIGVRSVDHAVPRPVPIQRATLESRPPANPATPEPKPSAATPPDDRLRVAVATARSELRGWPTLEAIIASTFERAPSVARAPVAVGDDAETLAADVRRATLVLRDTARLMAHLRHALAPLPSTSPVRAAINSEFGLRRSPWTGDVEWHRGVDIAATEGTPVRAPAPGAVVFSGIQGDYGLTVVLEHDRTIRTRYGHLSQVTVRSGDHVERGQILGRIGHTGRSTGAHLHYEVTVGGRPVDPRAYLWD